MDDKKTVWVEGWANVWKRYMCSSDDFKLGLPNQSLVISSGYNSSCVLEDWQAEIDYRAVGVIDAALDDMPQVESAAFYHRQLGCVFRFGVPVDFAYDRALALIGARLKAAAFS